MITIKNPEEMKKYYNEVTDTYFFNGNVEFDFNICVDNHIKVFGDITARDITARDIKAWDIKACDINACDIDALNINAHNITARDIKAWDINAHNITARNIDAWDNKVMKTIYKVEEYYTHKDGSIYKNVKSKVYDSLEDAKKHYSDSVYWAEISDKMPPLGRSKQVAHNVVMYSVDVDESILNIVNLWDRDDAIAEAFEKGGDIIAKYNGWEVVR